MGGKNEVVNTDQLLEEATHEVYTLVRQRHLHEKTNPNKLMNGPPSTG